MQRPREREHDAVGDLVRRDRIDALVDGLRLLRIALEAHERELAVYEAGVDRRDANWPAEEIFSERIDEASQPELRGDVRGGVRVRLTTGDRAHEEDVPAVADVRQTEPRHAHHPVDVRVEDGRLVLFVRLPEGIATEGEARVVEQDVDPAELRDCLVDERGAALRLGDVERQGHVRIHTLDASRATHDADARLA